MEQVLKRHVSGRLKVAPEHTADDTLKIMRNTLRSNISKEFKKMFDRIDDKFQLKQAWYLISSPVIQAAKNRTWPILAAETKDLGF